LLGGFSLGKLVGVLVREFCNHIIDCEWIEDQPDSAVMRMWALDRELVMRGDRFHIVTGWFTWLCMDMCMGRFLSQKGLIGVTTTSHVDFHAVYRTPETVLKTKLIDDNPDNYTMFIEVYASTKLVASGQFVFKVKERNDRR